MIYSHIYDSTTWKRISRIHQYMSSGVQEESDGLLWRADSAGQFSLKSVYNLIVTESASLDYTRFIWWL